MAAARGAGVAPLERAGARDLERLAGADLGRVRLESVTSRRDAAMARGFAATRVAGTRLRGIRALLSDGARGEAARGGA